MADAPDNIAWTENPLRFTDEDIEYFRNKSTIYIMARSKRNCTVLKGGLGFGGIGVMWGPEEPRHAYYRGYDTAVDADASDTPLMDDFQAIMSLVNKE